MRPMGTNPAPPSPRHIPPQKRRIAGFVEGARGEVDDGAGGVGFRGDEAVAVQFQEQHPDDEAGPLVPIDKGWFWTMPAV